MNLFIEEGEFQALFLGEITEPIENALKIIVHPAMYDTEKKPVMVGDIQLTMAREFWADTSKSTQIEFYTYIGYSVRNEMNCPHDAEEEYIGNRFRIYSRSKYLDFIKASTFIFPDQIEKIKHYGIYCENHLIDIISADEPKIAE
jgi:hypothetical protein